MDSYSTDNHIVHILNSKEALPECKIKIAGKNIRVIHPHERMLQLCKGYISQFDKADFEVEVTEKDLLDEAVFTKGSEGILSLQIKDVAITFNINNIEPTIVHKKIADIMPLYDTFLMHGSVISNDGNACMFTAPSGVGKTTRTKIWLSEYPNSIVVNGDKPLIRITDVGVLAYGSPWCGKEGWNTNTVASLRTVFLLERANDGEETSFEEVDPVKAFPFLFQQTHHPKDLFAMNKTIQLLKSLSRKVRIYRFRSTPTKESIRIAYEVACVR